MCNNLHDLYQGYLGNYQQNMPYLDIDKLITPEIYEIGDLIRNNFQNLIILGTGASSLNSQALMSYMINKKFNISYLDNLDPYLVHQVIKKYHNQKTAILVISKSGNTHEIINLTKFILNNLEIANNLFVITQNKDNSLIKLLEPYNPKILMHPDISGRFAIFSVVSLLPAYVAGIDLELVKQIIKRYLNHLTQNSSSIIQKIEWILGNLRNNRNNLVLMHYGQQYLDLMLWMRQVLAESLGKNGHGFNVLLASGTEDQHSQLQLYLDGIDDKFFSIYSFNKSSLEDIDSRYHILTQSLNLHASATVQALHQSGKQVSFYNHDIVDINFVVTQVIDTMIITVILAKIWGVNPYDQPAVELIKKLVHGRC